MSLKHAILAVLSHSDQTGYDLTREMDGSIANFWPATHQQVYLELKKLDELGFVHFKEKEQRGKPAKKIFSITRSGLAELKDWIAEPSEAVTSKDQLLVKLFASHLVSKEVIQKELLRLQELHQAKLSEYLEIERAHFSRKKIPSDVMAQYLTLRRGILYEQSWLKWCEECLERIGSR